MVSHQHEVPLELIRDDPSLIMGFLSSLGIKAPEFSEIRLDAAELNELKVTEHHADLVALFYNYGKVVFAVVLEVQLKAEPAKTATYERHSKFAIKHYALGKIAGRVEDILLILNARGVEVPADVRAEIARCDDLEQLDTWLIRAASASDVSELFEK